MGGGSQRHRVLEPRPGARRRDREVQGCRQLTRSQSLLSAAATDRPSTETTRACRLYRHAGPAGASSEPDGSADGNRPSFRYTSVADQEPFRPCLGFYGRHARTFYPRVVGSRLVDATVLAASTPIRRGRNIGRRAWKAVGFVPFALRYFGSSTGGPVLITDVIRGGLRRGASARPRRPRLQRRRTRAGCHLRRR